MRFSTGGLTTALGAQIDSATTYISEAVQAQISKGLLKSQKEMFEKNKQTTESYKAAVDARIQTSEARREESESRRREYELRCNELVGQIERYQASEDLSRQR